jgi:hypothetical protein
MHGIINQSIKSLIIENYGVQSWGEIIARTELKIDHFISDEAYDDEITFDLIANSSVILNLPTEDILELFGKHWVLNTGVERYGELMKSGGKDFKDFMKNLPNFHSRIMLIYPKLCPPDFKVEFINENNLILHYFSMREGLTYFVIGLIKGIAEMFNEKIIISLKESIPGEIIHDTFLIEII